MDESTPVQTRQCASCGEHKAPTEYGRNKRMPDGLQRSCRECARAWERAYRSRGGESYRKRKSETNREHYSANRDRIAEYRKMNRDSIREYQAEYQREYRASNPGKIAQKNSQRRARLAGAVSDPGLSWHSIAERDGMNCYLCGIECDPTDYRQTLRVDGVLTRVVGRTYPSLEHLVPLSKGGTDTFDNARLACMACNSIKGDRHG